MKRFLVLTIALLLCTVNVMAQEDYNKAQRPPQQKEIVLNRNIQTRGGHDSYQYAYNAALREARQTYPNKNVGIRNLTKGDVKINPDGSISYYYNYSIVELPDATMQKVYEAINKATREIEDSNRFAIDRISVYDEQFPKEMVKSNIIDYLIGRGYKVVAKENWKSFIENSKISKAEYTIQTRQLKETISLPLVTSLALPLIIAMFRCRSSMSAPANLREMSQ